MVCLKKFYFFIQLMQTTMSIDIHSQDKFHPYYLTWTAVDEFSENWESELASWHNKKCDMFLLVREGGPGLPEHLHYHSIGTFRPKTAGGVTRNAETFYKSQKMECGKKTVDVKSVKEMIGLFHYLTKDLEGPPLGLKGWKMSWIKKQCLNNLKKMPHKMLLKNQYMLSKKTAVNIIIEYAKIKSLPLVDKNSFRDCLKAMGKDHYRVTGIWGQITVICAEVLLECGHDAMFDQLFDAAFFQF